MTVIAYRDGVMAGDGRVTDKAFIIRDDDRKVFKLKDGSLLGVAGDTVGCTIIKSMLEATIKEKKKSLPNIPVKNAEALLVDPKGDIWWFNRGWEKQPDPYAASGSGWQVAMTAMDFGADAVTAAKAACRRTITCGGKITVVKL